MLIVAQRPAGTSRRVEYTIIGPDMSAGRRAQAERDVNRRVMSRTPLAPMVVIPPMIFGSGTPSIGIAGAELTRLNEGLRKALKVNGDGLFVIHVVDGTPAGQAGLMSGDVIVRAERELVQNPGQLIRLMNEAADNSLILKVLRERRERTLKLQW